MNDICGVTGLLHVLIKTNDLARTLKFYTQVIGLRESVRPPLPVPGAWLECSTPLGLQIIHIWAGDPRTGKPTTVPYGTATIDHVSFTAVGHEAYRNRFQKYGLAWREFIIPKTTLWQLFVYDPSGVQIELTFDSVLEKEPHGPIAPENLYTAGEVFFDPDGFSKL